MADVKVALFEREIGGIDVIHSVAITDGKRNKLTNLPQTTNVEVEIECKDTEVTSPTFLKTTTFKKIIGQSGESDIGVQHISASSRYKLSIVKVTDNSEPDDFTSCKSMQNCVSGCKIQGSCCGNCSFTPEYDENGNCINSKGSCTKGNGCCVKGCKIPAKVLENEETANEALIKALSDL